MSCFSIRVFRCAYIINQVYLELLGILEIAKGYLMQVLVYISWFSHLLCF